MLNHSGKAPEISRISALSYGVPRFASMDQALRAFFPSPLALVPLQGNLWHVPEMLPENSQEQRTRELRGSIHLLANAGEKKLCMVFTKWDLFAGKHQGLVSGRLPDFGCV